MATESMFWRQGDTAERIFPSSPGLWPKEHGLTEYDIRELEKVVAAYPSIKIDKLVEYKRRNIHQTAQQICQTIGYSPAMAVDMFCLFDSPPQRINDSGLGERPAIEDYEQAIHREGGDE